LLDGTPGDEWQSPALELLGPALDQTANGPSFKDSTAAQFLIAHYVVTNREGAAATAEKRERTYS
jgi:hypothetical protein